MACFSKLSKRRSECKKWNGAQETRAAELAAICDAIRACTDPSGPLLHADVPNAAQALLEVLEYCARDQVPLGNVYALGKFMALVWGRVVRYGYDESQRNDEHGWTMYLFNGATYARVVQNVIKAPRASLPREALCGGVHAPARGDRAHAVPHDAPPPTRTRRVHRQASRNVPGR